MEQHFWTTAILDFLIALGVVIGGVVFGGLGAFLTGDYPMERMMRLAEHLKIWAMVAAIGGTIDMIKALEVNILGGQINQAFQQMIFVLSAFIGAHTGTILVHWLIKGEI
ncbi:YtrH family sporulation protein [Hazenella coriacea]|uniref:Sporulation protein YtrH n=1 Tax=Hazenella coriacea TaxID=1179467 RepID=A0A4V2UVQ9_9BACL|nr:YtrH family sporulation protein [Hazenella coriacea]TCS96757.1 sporulation protein YtrH [Hazenella coriacea]